MARDFKSDESNALRLPEEIGAFESVIEARVEVTGVCADCAKNAAEKADYAKWRPGARQSERGHPRAARADAPPGYLVPRETSSLPPGSDFRAGIHVDGNYGSTLGYEPNGWGEWQEEPDANELPPALDGAADHWNFHEEDDD
jgi:hypothetical protein